MFVNCFLIKKKKKEKKEKNYSKCQCDTWSFFYQFFFAPRNFWHLEFFTCSSILHINLFYAVTTAPRDYISCNLDEFIAPCNYCTLPQYKSDEFIKAVRLKFHDLLLISTHQIIILMSWNFTLILYTPNRVHNLKSKEIRQIPEKSWNYKRWYILYSKFMTYS